MADIALNLIYNDNGAQRSIDNIVRQLQSIESHRFRIDVDGSGFRTFSANIQEAARNLTQLQNATKVMRGYDPSQGYRGFVNNIETSFNRAQTAVLSYQKTLEDLQQQLTNLDIQRNASLNLSATDPKRFSYDSESFKNARKAIETNIAFVTEQLRIAQSLVRDAGKGGIFSGQEEINARINIQAYADQMQKLAERMGVSQTKAAEKSKAAWIGVFTSIASAAKETFSALTSFQTGLMNFPGVSQAGSFIENILSGSLSGITSAISSGFNRSVERYDILNTYPTILQSIGYSSEQASDSMDRLYQSVLGLPTAFSDIVANAQYFVLMLDDLDKATDLAIAANNAFVASGSSSAQISTGMRDIQYLLEGTELRKTQWYSLIRSMPIALREIGDALGYVDFASFTDALMDGEIATNTLIDSLIDVGLHSEKLGNVLDVMKTRVDAALINVGNAAQRFGTNMLESLNTALTESGGKGIAENLKDVSSLLDTLGKRAAEWISAHGSDIQRIIDKFFAIDWGTILTDFLDGFLYVIENSVNNIDRFSNIIGGVFTTVKNITENISSWAKYIPVTSILKMATALGSVVTNLKIAGSIGSLVSSSSAGGALASAGGGFPMIGRLGVAIGGATLIAALLQQILNTISAHKIQTTDDYLKTVNDSIVSSEQKQVEAILSTGLSSRAGAYSNYYSGRYEARRSTYQSELDYLDAAEAWNAEMSRLRNLYPNVRFGVTDGQIRAFTGYDSVLDPDAFDLSEAQRLYGVLSASSNWKNIQGRVEDFLYIGNVDSSRQRIQSELNSLLDDRSKWESISKLFDEIGSTYSEQFGDVFDEAYSTFLDSFQSSYESGILSIDTAQGMVTDLLGEVEIHSGVLETLSNELTSAKNEYSRLKAKYDSIESDLDKVFQSATGDYLSKLYKSGGIPGKGLEEWEKEHEKGKVGLYRNTLKAETQEYEEFADELTQLGEMFKGTEYEDDLQNWLINNAENLNTDEFRGQVRQMLSEGAANIGETYFDELAKNDTAKGKARDAYEALTTEGILNAMSTQEQKIAAQEESFKKIGELIGKYIASGIAEILWNLKLIDYNKYLSLGGIPGDVIQGVVDQTPPEETGSSERNRWLRDVESEVKQDIQDSTLSEGTKNALVEQLETALDEVPSGLSDSEMAAFANKVRNEIKEALESHREIPYTPKIIIRGYEWTNPRNESRSRGGETAPLATGGFLFAPIGTDTIPAMLTPGEYVQRRAAVEHFGRQFMERINNLDLRGALRSISMNYATPYATGGFVRNDNRNYRDNHATVNQIFKSANASTGFRRASRFVRALG